MTTTLPAFTVTPAAVAAIESLGGAIALSVGPGGCCGTTYLYEVVEEDASLRGRRYGCEGAYLFVTPEASSAS